MKKKVAKRVVEASQGIYWYLNSREHATNPLGEFWKMGTKVFEEIDKAHKQNDPDAVSDAVYDLAFKFGSGWGFTMGNILDVTDPKIQAHVDTVKQVIRDKGLLPYVPRERKAA